jgi:Uma2 family endonuclease
VSDPAEKLATYEDLLRLPDGVRGEIIAGEIHTAPAPLPKHSKAQGAIRRFVGGPYDDDDGFGGPGGWWSFVAVDVQLARHDVVRPDLAGWRRPRLPNPADTRPIEVAPDWVCEVESPSTARNDRVTKRDLYAKHRVGHYWVVDVDARTLEAFQLVDDKWVLSGNFDETAVARIAPFEEVELAVGRLFLPAAAPSPAGLATRQPTTSSRPDRC